MTGEAVARVLASKHPGYGEGDIVVAVTGWRTRALSDGIGLYGTPLRKLDPAAAPVTTALGVLGMPGFTAYSGLRAIGKPQPGETVVVAAASGPVGSLAGQLANLAGARAVGIAGGPEKCAFVKDVLRFDAAVDHRAADFSAQLTAACPDGIDVYYENVGGAVWQAVLPLFNTYARIPVSGLIAQYNGTGLRTAGIGASGEPVSGRPGQPLRQLQHRGQRKAAELALDHDGERDRRAVIQVAADDLDPDW
jgi:NADPH-dependent curcumin reductase